MRNVVITLAIALMAIGCPNDGNDDTVDLSAAYAAAEYGDFAAVDMALGNGLDINKPDSAGLTLLHHAVMGNQEQLVIDLIEKYDGLDVNVKDANGYTARAYAVELQNTWLVSVLETAGATE